MGPPLLVKKIRPYDAPRVFIDTSLFPEISLTDKNLGSEPTKNSPSIVNTPLISLELSDGG